MDAATDSDAEDLLLEPALLSPADSSDDEILIDYLDDSQAALIPEQLEGCETSQDTSTVSPDREWVIGRIEHLIEGIVDGLLAEDGQLTLRLKTRSGLSHRLSSSAWEGGMIPPPREMELSYPGNSAQDAKRFTIVVRILELIHGCLIDDVVMTKRDLYYRHPDLFGKQSVVDRYVDDIACTLGISRTLLNVTAAAKGLIAGNFTLNRGDGTSMHGLSEAEGMMVPAMQASDALDMSGVRWILIIEKEATFRFVLSSPLWKGLGTQGLILTAKGYPDLGSRKFLQRVADDFPHMPMYALVDLDPDGIHIMSTYKHGSLRLAHEHVARRETPGVNLPNLQWLGVQSHHIDRAPGNEGDTATAALADVQGVMKLSGRDRKKAQRMLGWGVCGEHGSEPVWRGELQRMLMLNVKAEMQILDELPGGLVSWLEHRLEVMQGESADDELLF